MADTGLSPPLFREALVYREPLTLTESWQRWLSAFWQQAQTTAANAPGAGPWQPLDATLTAFAALTGTVDTLPYFAGSETMALAPLTAYSRSLLALGDAGTWRGALGLGSGAVNKIGVWQTASALTYDTLLHYDSAQHWLGLGTATPSAPLTFAATVEQKVHLFASGTTRYGLGVGTGALQVFAPGAGGASLQLGTMSTTDGATFTPQVSVTTLGTQTGYLGVGYPPSSVVSLRSGAGIIDSLRIQAGGTVAPRWPLDCPGDGHIARLGVWYGPDASVDFRTRIGYIDLLGVGTAPVAGSALRVGGLATFGSQVGIGYEPDAGYWLKAGGSRLDALTVIGSTTLTGTVGILGGPNASYNLTNHGSSYLYGNVGIGGAGPTLGYQFQVNGLTYFGAQIGCQGAPDSRFVARFYSDIYCDGIPYKAAGGPWVTYSDARMKHNIQPIPHPLETMTALRGVLYEWNDTADGKPPGVHMGVLAQEVEHVIPEWVGELSGYKTTQLSRFEALTIEAFKELAARVAALEDAECP